MSQNDMVIADADGATVLADLNSALQALASTSKGTGRPSTPYSGQLWIDDNSPSSTLWTFYLYNGTADTAIGLIDTVNNLFIPLLNPHANTVGGTANAITLDLTPAPNFPAYLTGGLFTFFATATNTGAVTVNVDGLGAKDIWKNGTEPLAAGDIVTGQAVLIQYDGTRFQMLNPSRRNARAYAEYTANADLTTQIPFDDTIPQNTEGTEIMTATITPKSTTNRVRVTILGTGTVATGSAYGILALFRDSVADALVADAFFPPTAGAQIAMGLQFEHVPGTTSAVTYKLRVGPNSTGAMRMNGTTSARRFGGAARVTMVVEEIAP